MLIEVYDTITGEQTIINSEAIERITENKRAHYDGGFHSDSLGTKIYLRSGVELCVSESYEEIKKILNNQ